MFERSKEDTIATQLITAERDRALRRAFRTLDRRCQALLSLLAAPDPPTYEEIGAALEMPIGAIGPTRARCLAKLRRSSELTGLELR
jgi:DNA-directed RNA polymerase specialized sigma24 family protein